VAIEVQSIDRGLREIYERLFAAYGPQNWWPASTPTEVVIGAILAQNTAWVNVERAIINLRQADALNWESLRDLPEAQLAELIRPSGTFRIKAARLKAFVDVLWSEGAGKPVYRRQAGLPGSLDSMLSGELEVVRSRLLAIRGIGPETADAILLYAGGRPSFVVDAYTKRILRRHFLIDDRAAYESVRELFQSALPADAKLYNEYHALLVAVAKKHCRVKAICEACPLADLPHDATR